MGRHPTLGKVSAGEHVRHESGWTGTVVDIDEVKFGRRLQVDRDDIPGTVEWHGETLFTRVSDRDTR